MTPLRKRMIEDLRLKGYADRTQQTYVWAVESLANHFGTRPDKLTEEQVRQYFVHLIETKKAAPSTVTIHLCGIKFFFEKTLKRHWAVFELVRPKRRRKLPNVLVVDEIRSILACVRKTRARVLLATIYGCGLRLSEGTHLKVADIDSNRMLVKVENGKGGKDRVVPLAKRTLQILREHVRRDRPEHYLFTASNGQGHFPNASIQKIFKHALDQSPVVKKASIHTLRHSYATHLLEHGIELPAIQKILGHRNVSTTVKYTHLTQRHMDNLKVAVNHVMDQL